MNTLVITRASRWFVIELGDQKLYVLNEEALRYNLKCVLKFSVLAVNSIMAYLTTQRQIEISMFGADVA